MSPDSFSSEIPLYGQKRMDAASAAFTHNQEYIEQQNGLEISGHLLRLAQSIKQNDKLVNKMSAFQVYPLSNASEQLTKRLEKAAKTIALQHDPYKPLSFLDFQSRSAEFGILPHDILALREYIVMDREAMRSKSLANEANVVQSELATDALTGLLTRKGLTTEIEKTNQILEARKKRQQNLTQRKIETGTLPPSYSLFDGQTIMIDLDFLKKINDTYNDHLAGDEALRDIATAIQAAIRGDDLTCRYGGDEFAIFLPGATKEVTAQVFERIQSHLAEIRKNKFKITVSAGAGAYKKDDLLKLPKDGFDKVVHNADKGLYFSKENGRNCFTFGPDDDQLNSTPPPPHQA